jgi:hypothetical protein
MGADSEVRLKKEDAQQEFWLRLAQSYVWMLHHAFCQGRSPETHKEVLQLQNKNWYSRYHC